MYKLEELRIGDVVCLVDQLYVNGHGYHNKVVTIGVVIYFASDISGHGPGDKPNFTSRKAGLRIVSYPIPTSHYT